MSFSPLQLERLGFTPALPGVLRGASTQLKAGIVVAPPSDAGEDPPTHAFPRHPLERLPRKRRPLAHPPFLTRTLSVPHTTHPHTRRAEAIAGLFPQTFGKPTLHIQASSADAPVTPRSPLRIGAVLSGGQAPGGHNVLSGIFDAVKRAHPDSILYGFRDGPRGVFKGEYVVIDDAMIGRYRNMGGALRSAGG